MDSSKALLGLAESIADGTAIDWDVTEAQALLEDRGVIRQLRILGDLAALHRSLPDAALPPSSTSIPAIGTWAHLVLREQLGAGTFGAVYRAWDPQLEREVALKLLHADSLGDLQTSRIAREGRLLARVRHPSVVTVHGVAVHEQTVGLWMELIRGATLEQVLRQQGPFGAREASLIGIEICGALAAVHGAGLIHRDIKTQNVMREDGGRIVLMDLGTGRERDSGRRGVEDLVGTPLFLAPEIFDGEPASTRSDLYSLGVLLYRLVTASFPVKATTLDELRQALDAGQSVRLRDARADLPAGFIRTIEQAIAADPERRHESAGALESDLLQSLEDGRSSVALASRSISHGHRFVGRVPSIAVLPFVDMSHAKTLEFFCDGISEEIVGALAKVQGLRVAARTSAFQFKGRADDIRRVGDVLNVETVLEGSVRAVGSRLRILTQLSNTTTGYQLWSERFDCDLQDLFAVQENIAQAIARTLRVHLDAPGAAGAAPDTTSINAHTLYLKGRYHWNKRTEHGLVKSVTYFQNALEHDPRYARAYAGLAEAYVTLGVYGVLAPHDVMPKARAAAEECIALSGEAAESLTSLGSVAACYDWAWSEAERHFQQALALSPDYPTAHHWYAVNVLVPQRRFADARTHIRTALELDPLSLSIDASVGVTAYFGGEYQEAAETLLRTIELNGDFGFAHFFLGASYAELSDYDAAYRALERALILSSRSPEVVAMLGYVAGRSGNRDLAGSVLNELTVRAKNAYVSAGLLAQVYAGLGDSDQALAWLERAVDQRAADLAWVSMRPTFASLVEEPRYRNVCEIVAAGTAVV